MLTCRPRVRPKARHMALALAGPPPALGQECDLLLAAGQRVRLVREPRSRSTVRTPSARLIRAGPAKPLSCFLSRSLHSNRLADQTACRGADDHLARIAPAPAAAQRGSACCRPRPAPWRRPRRSDRRRRRARWRCRPATSSSSSGRGASARTRPHQVEAGAHRPLGVLLVRLRVAEVCQHTVAHVLRDVAVVARDHRRAAPLVGVDDGAHVFGIETLREGRGADQVCEQDGQLPAPGSLRSELGPAAAGPGRSWVTPVSTRPPQRVRRMTPGALSEPQAGPRRALADRSACRIAPGLIAARRSSRQFIPTPRRTNPIGLYPNPTLAAPVWRLAHDWSRGDSAADGCP